MTRIAPHALLTVTITLAAACGGPQHTPGDAKAAQPAFRPIDPGAVTFWDRQTTESAKLLRTLVQEFNEGRDAPHLKVDHIGGYSAIYRKISASIQAKTLPDMAVGYESMTAEYVQAGAVIALDTLVEDPETGLASEELDDFFPVTIETNRYPQFDNKLYSFPFCKSVLMLYFNKTVLEEAGIQQPPKTWDEFIDQCRQIKARTGKFAHAISVDCSTIDGMIYSLGGEVVTGKQTHFDSPQALRVFQIYDILIKEELAFQIPPRSYDDEAAFAQDRIAFAIRSSSGRAPVARLFDDQQHKWGMAVIPQADPTDPHTVLFGPNICIFNTTPQHQRVAWEFIKFFTSSDTTVRWALGTGYVPIRQSAADDPRMKAFWDEWPYNRAAFDCLPFARSEPNLPGWQRVRGLVEDALTAVITGLKSPEQAAADLKQQADEALANP